MVIGLGFLFGLVSMATCVAMTTASAGDRSWLFHRCMWNCKEHSCTDQKGFEMSQPWYMRWLQWSCMDECDYMCMWHTVSTLLRENNNVPQFHGKWPFIRLYGIQEPASVIFSILNGLPHIYMILKFRRSVSSKAPMYIAWHLYAMAGFNTWFWSCVFHARDKPFTELMDYCCAFALVVVSFYMLWLRVLGTENWLTVGAVSTLFVSLFIYHVRYLSQGSFDYGYNMKANITIGLLNCACWLMWCFLNRREQHYVWKAATVSISILLLLSLELGDFPPYLWTFDAHSLWHAGTVGLPFLWYSYVIDDCQYMMNQQDKQLKSKTADTNGTSATGDTGSVGVGDAHANGFSTTETDIGHNVPTAATNYRDRVKLSHRPRKTFLQ
ncbi:Post-GPI attachment to proteins factor 3 [Lamellibrachia satsuma]|nr:Post-GPI attachment to proteins factor 3 [Lamellibrachia satsuma]